MLEKFGEEILISGVSLSIPEKDESKLAGNYELKISCDLNPILKSQLIMTLNNLGLKMKESEKLIIIYN